MSTDASKEIENMRAVLKRHVAQLGEHFDSVHIVVTKSAADGTFMVHEGGGNFYAQFGSMCEAKSDLQAQVLNSVQGGDDED